MNQQPDIVLKISKNDLKENLKLTYLFDAKYRIASDDNIDSKDCPPDDAINQMHRYRDAIYYQESTESSRRKKEVIGAYVLFPGSDSADDVRNLNFHKSIETVNIGAYPLIPGSKKEHNNELLTGFLQEILLDRSSAAVLRNDIAPYKALEYEDPDGLVLAGFVSSEKQRRYFISGNAEIYHMPTRHHLGSLGKLMFFCPIVGGIYDFYEIAEIETLPRNRIFDFGHELHNPTKADQYYVFRLRNRRLLPHLIESAVGGNRVFRYARLSQLKTSQSINEFDV